METKRDMLFIKGTESAFTNILLLIAVVIFIVPIAIVFTLRFMYKSVQTAKENISVSTQVDANFNKVY